MNPLPWPKIRSDLGPDLSIFRVRFDMLRNPRTMEELRRVVLETPDWCNIVALTPERNLVVVRQYRFGIEAVALEIPGGTVDPGEDSGDAAHRELLEETGYTAPRWTYLGSSEPNPAFLNNLCHHWLAEDALPTHSLQLGDGEDIVVGTLSLKEVQRAVKRREIRGAMVIAALARILDLREVSLESE